MYIKNFLEWIVVKTRTDQEDIESESKDEVIRKGEIRWSILGVNIGREMDGKGENFARPVLVLHTIGDSLALVVPLTSKNKNIPGYISFEWLDKKDSLCIHQIRVISTKRLLKRLAKISDNRLKEIKNELKSFYNF